MRSNSCMTLFGTVRTILLLSLLGLTGACSPKGTTTQSPTTEVEASPSSAPVGVLAPDEPMTDVPVEWDDARLGSSRAAVTVVAFLDFQCSHCRRGFETLLALRKAHSPEEVRIVFKHLPLESHPEAIPAAIIGQAVQQRLGSEAFFRFAETVFSRQAEVNLQSLARWANEVGLSREDYNELVSERETLERVIQDAQLASRLSVNATPTFFVNGARVAGAQPREVFQELIDREKAAMNGEGPWTTRYQRRVASNVSSSLVMALLEADPHDYRVPVSGSPVWGPSNALVTLVVFSDYECPFCKQAEQTVEQLRKEYADDLRVVFKHLPLPFHDQARPAAAVAVAAQQELGDAAFWEATQLLFEASPNLKRSALEEVGRKVGLSSAHITAALDSERTVEQLESDARVAEDVMARGTPHFFINGKRLSGARPIEQFRALIEFERARARQLVEAGVARRDVYTTLQKDALTPGAPQKLDLELDSSGRPALGPADAPITLAVFSDFQCPYCRKAERTLEQLRELYPGKIRTVWFDFPLPFHEQALPLARAARRARIEAGDDGFWRIHGAIFAVDDDAPRLSRVEVEHAAEAIGLDADAIGRAMQDASLDTEIERDIREAERIGIEGTPAFVINGYLVEGAQPLRFMRRTIEAALQERADRSPQDPEATGESSATE